MILDIKRVPTQASRATVTKAIAAVLHSDDFRRIPDPDERLTNFQVHLNESPLGGVRNNGSGTLTLPTSKLARDFGRFVNKNPIVIDGQQLKFFASEHKEPIGVTMTLEKTPYINPDLEEERQQKLYELQEQLRVDEVQFGVFYRSYPKVQVNTVPPRAFSIECKLNFATKSLGWLSFEYDHKLIRIELGDRMTEQIGRSIAIQFANIVKLAAGYDGNPFICFDILTPPILEEIDFNRPITGNEVEDSKKYRRRIGSLHADHAIVAPYAHQLRIVLYNDSNVDVVQKFTRLCEIAGLRRPINCQEHRITIEAGRLDYFTPRKLHTVKSWLAKLDLFVAFQIEALLRNARLNTTELLGELYKPIVQLCKVHPDTAREVLRHFNEALDSRLQTESPAECFKRVRDRTLGTKRARLSPGHFYCHHVTFTPTRLIVEGPFATQSNRVIRRYPGFEENFLRVDFREEDSLHYHWSREVDATSFLNERVGGVLKDGFELAGRRFEFLAYSSSALREHAVWFMRPFKHPDEGYVTSQSIRDSLGDFSDYRNQPSKYAARMAQAFTATDPSVKIRREEWEEIDDIGKFTDGVGTISTELSDRIWSALCASRRGQGKRSIKPSVYQIRFLGFKGVVGVDERLEGSKMCLRGSMKKFTMNETADADIEIARAFDYPNTSYLHRSMIMILEDRGVRREAFLELQHSAVADARMIDDSIEHFRTILKYHGLGIEFRVNRIMESLNKLGLDITDQNNATVINDPFLARLRRVAMNHVLRDIKHKGRIPVPKSYQLIGVADEGPAYHAKGLDNVYILPEGQIFACIQNSGDPEPTWLRGNCMISRSPVVHPGDVQRVYAIGKPPTDKICLFGHMKNVVVFPSVGIRPLPQCLGGGDLDGDTYDIVQYPPLLAPLHVNAGSYEDVGTREIETDCKINDICDFIVEYIRSDVLGLLSDRHLVIADQSKEGTQDPKCLKLAALCSQAVDYPKNGIAVDLDNDRLPGLLIRCKPDWHAAEVVAPRQLDYYTSTRALGYLYRDIELDDPSDISGTEQGPSTDVITGALLPLIEPHIPECFHPVRDSPEIAKLFQKYVGELRYICSTHTLSNGPGVQLLEEEVVAGTILAKCSQQRWRKGRIYRMKLHASVLVESVQHDLEEIRGSTMTGDWLRTLENAWTAWRLSVRNRGDFGSKSFGLIALGVIFDLLEKLGETS